MENREGQRMYFATVDIWDNNPYYHTRRTIMSYDAYDGFYGRLMKLNGRVISAVYKINGMKTGTITIEYYRPPTPRERHNRKKVEKDDNR